MITVRFPSGFSIQYNDLDQADFSSRSDIIFLGRKKQPGVYYVAVPRDCVIEHIAPCRTYHACDEASWKIVDNMRREIESLKRKLKKVGAL